MVKSQATDIVDIILQLIRRPNGVHRACRNRKSRGELLSTSEVQWSTTKSDGVWINKLPKKLAAITSPVRKALRSRFHTLLYRARQRKGLRVFALGQRLRRFVDHVATTAGTANGERVRQWIRDKKAGWYAVLADPQMPASSTLLDQAHNAIDRKLFMMKGFHHSAGVKRRFSRDWRTCTT